jgi:hypothetical protein
MPSPPESSLTLDRSLRSTTAYRPPRVQAAMLLIAHRILLQPLFRAHSVILHAYVQSGDSDVLAALKPEGDIGPMGSHTQPLS